MVGNMLQESIQLLEPVLVNKEISAMGKVVIGTVEGDLHDIGKNLVAYMLSGAGFEVRDLGVDVSANEFVEVSLLFVSNDFISMKEYAPNHDSWILTRLTTNHDSA